ncbi:hypothetical protein GAGA_0883 [Paraglaciecola agarilytica NO2]|uniref:Uncharacterized protein n=1 Tax=Paraglaciecola agarilytica NO2 TaxID=1125747 RepID=A0ABQ0I343_9ALTE|nr:hypothetical protein GAGA_0883 [Paraglaciecola agarilytica NO2]
MHIASCDFSRHYFTMMVDDEKKFEAIKQAHRTFASLSYIFEGFIPWYPNVVAHFYAGRVNEFDTCSLAFECAEIRTRRCYHPWHNS